MNDHKKQKFKTDIGINATVQRAQANPEISAKPNRMLIDLGQSFSEIEQFKLKGYDYRGSVAVHIYTHELLNQIDFISQTYPLDLYRCPEVLAKKSIDDLIKTVQVLYGHKRSVVRSGF